MTGLARAGSSSPGRTGSTAIARPRLREESPMAHHDSRRRHRSAGARAARRRHRHADRARSSASATRRRSRMFDRGRTHALRSRRPCGDPHRAQRQRRSRRRPSTRRATRRCASARRPAARMERFTRPLMAQYGVRIIIGKGGLGAGLARGVPRARRRLSRDHRRHRGARDDVDRGDRGRRSRRPQSREPVAVPRARLRSAARRDGQPRRQPLRRGRRGRAGESRRGAGVARRQTMTPSSASSDEVAGAARSAPESRGAASRRT